MDNGQHGWPGQIRAMVIDDDPHPLVTLLRDMTSRHFSFLAPAFTTITRQNQCSDLVAASREADVLLLDHHLAGKFGKNRTGANLGMEIAEGCPGLPIYFYTAFDNDVIGRGKHGYIAEVERLIARGARIVDKGTLDTEESVIELGATIVIGALTWAVRKAMSGERERGNVLASSVVRWEERAYKLRGWDGRKSWHTLIDPALREELGVPTRFLQRAGVDATAREVLMRVYELSGGQVLSTLMPLVRADTVLPPDVVEEIREEE